MCIQARQASEKAAQKVAADKEVEAQRKLAKGEEDAKQRQAAANRSSAVANFRTLLSEMVRDPTASWHDYSARLERDPQVSISPFPPPPTRLLKRRAEI